MPQPIMEWESRISRRVRLRDLYILSAVADAGRGMAKAAIGLRMSQPSVSEAIANLESALRVRLLDRSPRGAEPTSYANVLLRRGRIVFDELNQGVRILNSWRTPRSARSTLDIPKIWLPALSQLSSLTCRVAIQDRVSGRAGRTRRDAFSGAARPQRRSHGWTHPRPISR